MADTECTYAKTFYLKKPQILTFFESDKGKSMVNSLQDQEGCAIEVEEYKTDISTPLNLSFLKQQITDVADDVIVSSIGRNLDMGIGQLSRCILKAAGEEIGEESRQKCPAGLSVAEIVETSGGKLKCKAIYHCCLPHWKSTDCRPDEVLRQVVRDCLIKASTQGYKSIAFPALGSGNLGYPECVTAAAIIDTVRECDHVPLSLVDVHVVGLPEDFRFEEAYKLHLQKETAPENKSSGTSQTPPEDDMLESFCHRVLTKPPMPAAEHPSTNEAVASVTVYCQENKCDEIYKKLADRCDEDYTRKVVDQRILKLTSSKTKDLVAFAKRERVDVRKKGRCEVHLNGPFQSLNKVCHHLDETLQTVADLGFVAYPTCWERVESGQRVFNVAEESIEYVNVKDSFMTALGEKGHRATIFKIERIQIPDLYRQYQIAMKTVQKEHPSEDNERIMWHGTDVEAVPNINKYGFNRSYSGKNATLYGQGVYFAMDAITSSVDMYSPKDTSGIKYVYRARVLTGRYTKGDAKMRDPPRVDPIGSVRFTSTTDNTSRPSLFCIYRDTHSYPEYLISFQLRVPQTP